MQESTTVSRDNNSNRMLKILAAIALVAIVGVGIASATRSNQAGQPAPETLPPLENEPTKTSDPVEIDTEMNMDAPAGSPTASPGTEAQGEVRTINLEAGSFYFTPAEIRVKKGETVRIVMTSKDMMHDFVIDELGVKIPVTQSGRTNTVEFTADTVGEFEYYCSVGNHRAQGQVGTLIVTE